MSEHHNGHGGSSVNFTPGPNEWDGLRGKLLLLGIVGFVAFGVLGAVLAGAEDYKVRQFFQSYFVGYNFWLSLPLGSTVLLMVQHIAAGRWGRTLRRPLEANTRTLPLMFVLLLPMFIGFYVCGTSDGGKDTVYWWANIKPDELSKEPEEVQHRVKEFLNPATVMGVTVVLFALWGVAIYLSNSVAMKGERNKEYNPYETQKRIGGVTLVAHAIMVTIFCTFWVVSLEKTWASTMFPVIYAVNQILTSWAFCIVTMLILANKELNGLIHKQDKINMGSFLLAFTLFWSYTNFSQYMLVWVGNLPEEIPYYLRRSNGGWEFIAYALMIFHFAAPFILLLFRNVKEHPKRLQAVAIGLMVMCWIDVFWYIEPSFSHEGQSFYWLLDVAATVGIGGLWGWYFIGQLRKAPLLPTHEQHFDEGDHGHGH